MLVLSIDRWLLNHLFCRKRIFTIDIDKCVDEFGNSFGSNGDHHFVKALNKGEDFESLCKYLKDFYKKTHISSFGEFVSDKDKKFIDKYFCPWELDRIRNIDKFISSHKIGPTSDSALETIVNRLLRILNSIRNKGFKTFFKFDGYPRVIELEDENRNILYLVRDGNHRLSVLSHLGYKKIKVCYEKDHWNPSIALKMLFKFLKRKEFKISEKFIYRVSYNNAHNWALVKNKFVNIELAKKFFMKTYSKAFNNYYEKSS